MALSNHSRQVRSAVALTFVCTAFFAGTPSAQAGINVWTVHGPGGSVSALAIDPIEPRRVYAGTGGGVFAIEQAQVVGTGTRESCTEWDLDDALAGGGLVTFDCGLAPVTITITSTKTIAADTTMDGGSLITISGGNTVGVFSVNTGVTFTVQNLTIANGNNTVGSGAGIYNGGTLTVTNSTFSGNGVISGNGGIYNGGTLTVTNSTFSGNSAAGNGGGISNQSGTLTVTNSTFSGNSAGNGGGGIANGGTLTVTNSTFSGNSAGYGDFERNGGGIANGGTLTVTNSTFSGNSATSDGGDISNHSGTVTVTNTILGDCSGAITDGGHNLQFRGSDCGETIQSLDPLLDPAGLADNGGPTQTIALLPDSPAIDAGDPEVCARLPVNGIDQRGFVRPGIGQTACSIGAYEADATPCTGDCDGNGVVAINELILGVNIALDVKPLTACPVFANSEGRVDIAQLVTGVDNALHGCGR